MIISNYRFHNISKQCEKLHLTTVNTGVETDYCFAVREGNTELYSIIAAITNLVPDSVVHTSLTYYSTEDAKTGIFDIIKDNLLTVMAIVLVILLIIILLLLKNIRTQKEMKENAKKVKMLNRRVFVDALTSVQNKGAYTEYVQNLQERIDNGKQPEFAIGIFDCNNLKTINDHHGHDKGDIYLKSACKLICNVFDHSPVFRIGGDEFAVILQNNDFEKKDELIQTFEERRKTICNSVETKWEEVHIAVGIAVYDPLTDDSVEATARRSDAIMYKNKEATKAQK